MHSLWDHPAVSIRGMSMLLLLMEKRFLQWAPRFTRDLSPSEFYRNSELLWTWTLVHLKPLPSHRPWRVAKTLKIFSSIKRSTAPCFLCIWSRSREVEEPAYSIISSWSSLCYARFFFSLQILRNDCGIIVINRMLTFFFPKVQRQTVPLNLDLPRECNILAVPYLCKFGYESIIHSVV